jgi:hypothetical protein
MVISFVNAGLSFVEGKGGETAGEGNASLCRLTHRLAGGRHRPYSSSAIRFFVKDGLSLPNPVKKA